MNGIFAVRKPSGPTSQDVVAKLKHIFTRSPQYLAEAKDAPSNPRFKRGRKQKFIKIGHGGTLDPLADGALVIGVGSGTKQLAQYLGQCSKVYTARALLGASTTTFDSEGAVLEYGTVDPATVTVEQLAVVLAQFRGAIQQLPPVFSALKMDGKPLYEYAREGLPLPRAIEPRDCEVSRLEAGPVHGGHALPASVASDGERSFAEQVLGRPLAAAPTVPEFRGAVLDLTFSVSSGTYIRTLIHDIGEALGTKAHMVKLTRTSQGQWELGKNVLPLELFQAPNERWWPVLETVLTEGPKRRLDEAILAPDPAGKAQEHTEEKVNGKKAEERAEEKAEGKSNEEKVEKKVEGKAEEKSNEEKAEKKAEEKVIEEKSEQENSQQEKPEQEKITEETGEQETPTVGTASGNGRKEE